MEDAVKVKIYSKDHCSSCVRVKRLLDEAGVHSDVVDLTGDLDGMKWLAKATGRMTLPQVFVGAELIGGFEETVLALRNQRIRDALGVI